MATAAQPHPDVLIDIQHVTYTHWNKTEPTLHDVSLQVNRGTLNILVGPDGQNTRDVKVKDLAQKVGRVFQDPEIMFATLSVEDEIAFGPENLRIDIPSIQRRTLGATRPKSASPQDQGASPCSSMASRCSRQSRSGSAASPGRLWCCGPSRCSPTSGSSA